MLKTIFTAQHIFSIIFIIAAYFQFRFSRNYKKTMMKRGTSGPATFGASMMVGNYAVVVTLLIVAISLLIGPLSH
ncbi:hypothetical protein ACFQAV_08000 [Companilactobacillus huachuanensis]|uniref:Uncharacterized protein n=1 Tax=Companilactobacillus huachuanensis TaxID=2559914 RepID=A0ABW1RNU7_9LACO|nr:hypothetical protein [Companilactobacillus huachuanensis]